MNRNLISLLFIMLSGCTAPPTFTANEDLLKSGFPGIPQDAAEVAERLASCQHFSGEIGDNSPERALEIDKAMSELRCDSIEPDVKAILTKYSGNRSVHDALTAASEL
jgi:hypothetical protein